jgi:hypothetical protein
LYFDIVISFFHSRSAEYPILIAFGLLLAVNKPIVWIVNLFSTLFNNIGSKSNNTKFLGSIIGHESTDLYKVELLGDNPFRSKDLKGQLVYLENRVNALVGIVLSERILVGKKWIEILTLRDTNQNPISFNIKSLLPLSGENSIFSKTNAVYLLDDETLHDEVKAIIALNPIKTKFEQLIGNVWEGSTINKIRFNKLFTDELLKERGIGEGSVIQTEIANEEVLYQIIDAKTDEESLEFKDTHGFTIGTAQKLGRYSIEANEINTVKWLPEIYTPIFLLNPHLIQYNSRDFIGKLPNTNYGIPIKKPHELVTHNTAILGILGIGKSCLTFELIQKLIATTNVKVFCIDLTSQYEKELPAYVTINSIEKNLSAAVLTEIKSSIKKGTPDNSESWGNVKDYTTILEREINSFIASDRRILTLNPDLHSVEKANAEFKITHNEPLTVAHKARIISERIFVIARTLGETKEARFLIVFEEAHSLIPEWNAVANDGDKTATNGTAKVFCKEENMVWVHL